MKRYEYLDQAPDFVQEAIEKLGPSAVYPMIVILSGDKSRIEELIPGGRLSSDQMRDMIYERLIVVTQNSRKI